MKFAIIGDDFFHLSYEVLLSKGFTLIGAWLTERDNIFSTNLQLKALCERVNAPILGNKASSEQLKKIIEEDGLEFLLVAYHNYIVPVDCLPKYHLNMHPSLLPEGRGSAPIPECILRGESKTGVTLHKLTEKFDQGDIVIQEQIEIAPNETHDSLSMKTIFTSLKMISKLCNNFEEYWRNAKPQTEGSYWQKRPPEHRIIDWNMTVSEIDRLIRAYGRFGVNVKINEKIYTITHALCWEEKHNFAPGTLISGFIKDIAFACKDGFVCVYYPAAVLPSQNTKTE
jgi:methionyl-tRNA formyltransferase